MHLCLYVYGLVFVHYVRGVEEVLKNLDDDSEVSFKNITGIEVKGVEKVYKNSVNDYEIPSRNNTQDSEVKGVESIDHDDEISIKNSTEIGSVIEEQTEMDYLMEFTTSSEDHDDLLSQLAESDVIDETDAIGIEEVERNARALTLSEEFQPLFYPYWSIFADTNQQYIREGHFSPSWITKPHNVPIKQTVPTKGKVTIVGSFTDFNWNIPITSTTKEHKRTLDYDDNIGVESEFFYNNVYSYLPNMPFLNRRPPFMDVPSFNDVKNNELLYDNGHFPKPPFYEHSIRVDEIPKKIPVTGKFTVAATFGDCCFM